jgi:hypothetical protein
MSLATKWYVFPVEIISLATRLVVDSNRVRGLCCLTYHQFILRVIMIRF